MVAPDTGDIIWLNFNPQRGHEQAGTRPALVLSPRVYNQKSSLLLCCPITSKIKGHSTEVRVQGNTINGVVLCGHIKSLDWRARDATFIEKAPALAVEQTKSIITTLLQL